MNIKELPNGNDAGSLADAAKEAQKQKITDLLNVHAANKIKRAIETGQRKVLIDVDKLRPAGTPDNSPLDDPWYLYLGDAVKNVEQMLIDKNYTVDRGANGFYRLNISW